MAIVQRVQILDTLILEKLDEGLGTVAVALHCALRLLRPPPLNPDIEHLH